MTQTMDCGNARICLGVYVLGSIDPADRALVDSHLGTCRDCRDELAGLAGIPALLARVDLEEAIALAEDAVPGTEPKDGPEQEDGGTPEAGERPAGTQPPRELLGTVLDLAAARRRRQRWRTGLLSAAAAVIIAAGAFGGAEVAAQHKAPGLSAGSPDALDYGVPQSGWSTLHGSAGGMYGTVTYRGMGWGTQVGAKVVGVPVGTYCTLVAVGKNGTRTTIGGWTTDNVEGTIWYPASSGLPESQVREFQITVTGRQAITIPA
jgi:predicted anti-sigma-YlaC factor YlaD